MSWMTAPAEELEGYEGTIAIERCWWIEVDGGLLLHSITRDGSTGYEAFAFPLRETAYDSAAALNIGMEHEVALQYYPRIGFDLVAAVPDLRGTYRMKLGLPEGTTTGAVAGA